jgi:hypothetical protein
MPTLWGEDPIGTVAVAVYVGALNILLLLLPLLVWIGGGGFYFGGPIVGGSGIGLILLICLVIYLGGGSAFRKANKNWPFKKSLRRN